MGQVVVNVGSYDLTSHNGNTAYGSIRYFDIPANAGITACVATFATHVNTGNFQGKALFLNGVQAHPNTPWPTSGISLNVALLSTGQNAFRVSIKSQTGLSARWSIGDIYLTISYTDPAGSGGGGGSSTGGVSVDKTWIDAGGGNVTVTSPAQANRWQWGEWSFGGLSGTWSHPWNTGGSYAISVPIEWCNQIPNAVSGILYINVKQSDTPSEPYNFVSEQNFQVQVNVPAYVVPTIGSFTSSKKVNNVPEEITGYVQSISGVDLAINGAAGAFGSSMSAYRITGGGLNVSASVAALNPIPSYGNIVFTAEVTDSRGRKATATTGIDVDAYMPPGGTGLSAFRSNASKVQDPTGAYATLTGSIVFSSLNGENIKVIKGRVYEKGTSAPALETMTEGVSKLFGGSLSTEKAYTAEIVVSDRINSQSYKFDIPTAMFPFYLVPGNNPGAGFGMAGQAGRYDFAKPVYSEGAKLTSSPNPNLLHNWDFTNPVNQRDISGTWTGYGIDRWYTATGTAQRHLGFVLMDGALVQQIEGLSLVGKICTFSVNVQYGSIVSATFTIPATGEIAKVVMNGLTLAVGATAANVYVVISTTSAIGFLAAKLEIGTLSTLHLDPPMDYGVELPKCQRFFQVMSANNVSAVDLRPSMRITPTVTGSGPYYYSADL